MKYIRQLGIILLISLIGELLKWLIPLPVPASIYGLLLMLLALQFKVFPLESVKETGNFLIEIMPLMFIPAGVGLLDSWKEFSDFWIPVAVITCVSTVFVMVVTGHITQFIIRRERKKEKIGGDIMQDFLGSSMFFGVTVSIVGYLMGIEMKKKWKLAIFNPLLVSILFVMLVLKVLRIPYQEYHQGAKYLSYLLTPATVCLAIPLYQQLALLKENKKALLLGIGSGAAASLGSIFLMSKAFGLTNEQCITLLPKSITTAIGMSLSEEMGGIVTITVATIIITGVLGNVIAEGVCRLFRITEPIAKGAAIGTSSHAIGTSKAIEIGEVEGAMSSLAIAVAGLLTVVGMSVLVNWM